MKMTRTKTLLAAGAIALPVAGVELYGQLEQTDPQQRAGQQQQQQQQQDRIGQQQQRPGQTGQRMGQQRGMRGQQNQQLQQYVHQQVLAANEAEIRLSRIAQQRAQNDEVRQFAQKMAEEHQQIVQDLRDAQQQTRQPQMGAGEAEVQQELGMPDPAATRGSDATVQRIIQFNQQVRQQATQALEQRLQEKQGTEFDSAYMGMQIAAHDAMLALLEVAQQEASPDARQTLQQAHQSTQQHLQEAEQIMQRLSEQR